MLPQGLIAGKPVISYDVDGAKEVIISGETGYLLPPQSVAELSNAINILVADPACASPSDALVASDSPSNSGIRR